MTIIVLFTKNEMAIRSIWQSQLRSALESCLMAADIPHIPLHSRDVLRVAYRSAIALQLASQLARSPLEIAREIAANLPKGLDFAVSVSPPGWIDCQLTDVGWAQWLQHLTGYPRTRLATTQFSLPPGDGFLVQYAHARCCTWLQLADREGLILLQAAATELKIIAPDPLPWLDDTQSLYLQHPAERALMSRLVTVVDALEDPASLNFGKLALNLSEAFVAFESQCRMFGEVKTANPPLAIGRSGLVGATQRVLKCLLDQKLGILSPMEL
jgi:arginyl-tRNA synthetase